MNVGTQISFILNFRVRLAILNVLDSRLEPKNRCQTVKPWFPAYERETA